MQEKENEKEILMITIAYSHIHADEGREKTRMSGVREKVDQRPNGRIDPVL